MLRPLDPKAGHGRPKDSLNRGERRELRKQRNDTSRRRPFLVRNVKQKR